MVANYQIQQFQIRIDEQFEELEPILHDLNEKRDHLPEQDAH